MAFPSVRSSSTGNSNSGTSPSLVLPATINSGDLILAFGIADAAVSVTWDNSTAGTFTQEFDQTAFSSVRGVCYAKVADGTEDSASLTLTLGASDGFKYFCYAVQDWEGTLSTGLYSATATTSGVTAVDPPNLDPGAGAQDYMWIAASLSDNIHTSGLTSYSTNYNDNQLVDAGNSDTAFVSYATCTRELNASSEDPGVITWASNARNGLVVTLAVAPAAAGGSTPHGPLGLPLNGPLGGPFS